MMFLISFGVKLVIYNIHVFNSNKIITVQNIAHSFNYFFGIFLIKNLLNY